MISFTCLGEKWTQMTESSIEYVDLDELLRKNKTPFFLNERMAHFLHEQSEK